MAGYIVASDANFKEEVLDSEIPVLVDFWAEWCAPCRLIAPIVDEIGNEMKGKLKVAKLDVDNNPKVSMNYGIRSIPTIIIFRDGKPADTIIGAVPKQEILDRLEPVL